MSIKQSYGGKTEDRHLNSMSRAFILIKAISSLKEINIQESILNESFPSEVALKLS